MYALRRLNDLTVPCSSAVTRPSVVRSSTPRSRGRPRKEIDTRILRHAIQKSNGVSISKLAKILKVHRNTLAKKVKEAGLLRHFTDISDNELDEKIRTYKLDCPTSGYSYVRGFLKTVNICVPRQRLRDAIRRIDGVGVTLRARARIIRGVYINPRPMAVWHCDGHMKGNRWGIAIHGFIDGYSRKVCMFPAFPFKCLSVNFRRW